jgi:hypothetical protein
MVDVLSTLQDWNYDLVFVLKTVSKKPKTVSHAFSIHFVFYG